MTGRWYVRSARIPTYSEEYCKLDSGPPCRISIVGRLDLLAFAKLDRLIQVLPVQAILFDLSSASRISVEGKEALLNLLGKREATVLSLQNAKQETTTDLSSADRVYADDAKALAALGDGCQVAVPWYLEPMASAAEA